MYPPLLPEAPLPLLAGPSGSENPQIPYHLNVVQAKRAIASGITSALAKKYQQKLKKSKQ